LWTALFSGIVDKKLKPVFNPEAKKYKGEKLTIISSPALSYWQDKNKKRLWQSAFPENC
jgi:hypothetical protein